MALVVARHAEREDYAWKARGESWQAQSERPWDTPLTVSGGGLAQAEALGHAVAAHLVRLGLPPVSRVFCSPLLRCAQTAAGAAAVLGIGEVSVENALAETCCEQWYRSWGVPGSDSAWGGPPQHAMGCATSTDVLHPACLGLASACHNSAADLDAELQRQGTAPSVRIVARPSSGNSWAADAYSWGSFETESQLQDRMAACVDSIRRAHPGESVLCLSHGGPTGALYAKLTQQAPPLVRYTGLFVYVPVPGDDEASPCRWKAPVAGDDSHLAAVAGATADGPSSAAEQGHDKK